MQGKQLMETKSNKIWEQNKRIIVECGEGPDTYHAVIFAKASNAFNDASLHPDIKGEDRVKAILAAGGVSSIERRKGGQHGYDGYINDGEHGEPALERFHEDGQPWRIKYAEGGTLRDGANGEEAYQAISKDYIAVGHCKQDGRFTDVNGEGGFRVFENKGNMVRGKLLREDHYENGMRLKKRGVAFKKAKAVLSHIKMQ
jgi:hypothetical protein